MSQISRIPFVKATAYGNDFLIIRKEFQGVYAPALTRALCDRHFGVGADGVEWLSEESGHAARIHLINADGSFAELSGNGTRCVAAHLVASGAAEELLIATDAGSKRCQLTGRSGNRYDFLTDMGTPVVDEPFEIDLGHVRYTGCSGFDGQSAFCHLCYGVSGKLAEGLATDPGPHGLVSGGN